MPLPVPNLPPPPAPSALVQTLQRTDVLWNRPVFRAPSLDRLHLPALDTQRLAQDLQRIGLVRH
ncbi:MAG: hypothetical protein JNK23_21120 [Opitutaceae bacterium]|nr:hypothetical protein [Opitutaceae bacterium]